MKKYILSLYWIICCQFIIAQNTVNLPKKNIQKGFLQLDYMAVKMPFDFELNSPEKNMGFAGVHYNLHLNKTFYTGAGFYGSVSGKRGGLFTLGVNLGAKLNVTQNFFIDSGMHFGAGGGASAPDGGGAMFLPHVNIGYKFNDFSITSGWSYVNFFDDGLINSHQINVAVQIPISFAYTSFKNKQKNYAIANLKNTNWNKNSHRFSLMLHLNNVSPFGNSQLTGGTSLNNKTINLAGFEVNSYFSKNWFLFFKADGAYNGIQGGYMDILLGSGYHFSFNKNRTNILTKFGIGAGGGGGVDSAGGFFIYPDISIEQKLFDNVFLAINKGLLLNPDSHFASNTLGFGLKYYINQSGITSEEKTFTTATIKGVEIVLGQDVYFNAKRYTQPTTNLYQLGAQANIYLTKNIFIAGKTSFANFGNAGAYAEGIVGTGIRSNSFYNDKINVFVQGLAGAAGGGDISTGQGFIIKPSAGIYLNFNEKLSLRSEGGYVKARGGTLSSSFFNLGLSYQIGSLIAK